MDLVNKKVRLSGPRLRTTTSEDIQVVEEVTCHGAIENMGCYTSSVQILVEVMRQINCGLLLEQ